MASLWAGSAIPGGTATPAFEPVAATTPSLEIPRPKAIAAVAKDAQLADVAYPADLERVVTLSDGSVVRVRPIRPDDESRLQTLFERLSPQTVYQRFFTTHRRLPAAWYREFANVDYAKRFAFVAEEVGVAGIRLRGVARWEPGEEPGALETALVIEDAWQGRGLGATMFRILLDTAHARGFDRFCADVLAENSRMLRLLRTQTEIQLTSVEQGVVHACFSVRREAAPEGREAAPEGCEAAPEVA